MDVRNLLKLWGAAYSVDNVNKSMAMQRALAAKNQGLDPAPYGVPLPGSVATTITNNAKGWLPGAILGAVLLAAGGGAGAWLLSGHKPTAIPRPTAPLTTAPAAASPTTAPAWDAIYEQQDPKTGEWKQLRREHLTPGTTP